MSDPATTDASEQPRITIPPSSKGRFPFLMAIAVLICGIGIGFFIGRVSAPTNAIPPQQSTTAPQPQPMGPPPPR